MEHPTIKLISYGQFEAGLVSELALNIRYEFNLNVSIEEQYLDLSDYYDPARRQYDANKLLMEIDSLVAPVKTKTIGLFRVDLFIPILTYVFGQAFLKGNSGIASVYRLKNELYGLPPDPQLLKERFSKVVKHEIGHTFGLIHCHVPGCVMISATYMEDIDQKKDALCPKCRAEFYSLLND
ncbi:MAG: archaemetzincin family Zn-dependent metalloprotease [Bacteroidales bacterium]